MIEKIHLTGKEYRPHIEFWKNYLSEHGEGFSFRQKNDGASGQGSASYTAVLPEGLCGTLYQLNGDEPSGIFVCMAAALGIVLRRYTGEEKIIVNSPVLGSDRQDRTQDIPLAIRPANGSTLRAYLNDTMGTVRASYAYQDLPIGSIAGGQELFTSNILVRQGGLHGQAAGDRYDLIMDICRNGNAIELQFHYDIRAFEDPIIAGLSGHLMKALTFFKDLGTLIGDIQVVDGEEKEQLITGFNDTHRDHPLHKTVVTLFEDHVRERPSAVALVCGDLMLTYEQLDREANRLARHLAGSFEIGEGDIAAVMAVHSERLIIAILAVLKTGAAYLPIDPVLPAERKKYMLSDTPVKVLLTDSELFFEQDYYSGKAFLLDLELSGIPETHPGRPATDNPASLAYVIYTSGSTGVPKGVLIRHYGLTNVILEQIRQFGILPEDKLPQFASISFDASPSEIFKALCSGAQLVITDRSLTGNTGIYLDHLKKAGITMMTLPPSYQSAIGWEELLFLRILVSAGEKLNVRAALELSRSLSYFNAYGPTECTIGSAYHKIEPYMTPDEAECIGFPVANAQVYILTPDLYPVPVGITGEIFIGGAGVAVGYQHLAALTEEKFILNPFSDVPGSRLYRSGDYGRWRPDGKIAFTGRRDDQVKIRGFRVEIGEIEQVLQLHPQVRQSAILVKEDDKGDKRLVAFVVTDGEFSRNELVDHLAARLPEYMVPGLWINLPALPMTNNRKVDKKALLELSAAGKVIEEHAGPRNSMEEKLVDIWKEVLQLEIVGIYDDFFELGGDSLSAIRLSAFIREVFSLNVPVNVLFEFTTISDLAEYLYVIAVDQSDSNETGTEVLLV